MEREHIASDSIEHRRRPFKRSTTTVCACRSEDPLISLFARAVLCILCSSLHIPRFESLRDRTSLHRPVPFVLPCISELHSLYTLLRDMASSSAGEFGQEDQFAQVRIKVAMKTMRNILEGRLTRAAPPQIKDTRGKLANVIPDTVARDWIRFGMPPIIVYLAHFANSRSSESYTGKDVHILHSMMKCCKAAEKTCNGAQFIRKGERFLKLFQSHCVAAGGPSAVSPFIDEDLYHRLDEFWAVVYLQFVPKPINEIQPVTEAEQFLAERIQLYGMATVIDSEPHPASWLALTRTADYTKIMRETSQINPGSEDPDKFYTEVATLVRKEVRFHNMNFPNEKVVLQDIMLDFAGTVRDHGKGRSAAQNRLMCVILLSSRLELMKKKSQERYDTAWKATICEGLQGEIIACHDIPDDILLNRSFNVSIAEDGANFYARKARSECMKAFTEFATKMSDTQGATAAEAHRFDDWRTPLDFGDGRRPVDPSPYGHPDWIDPVEDFMTEEERQRSDAARGSRSPRGGSRIQPKKMPRQPGQPGTPPPQRASGSA
eukprot:s70_g5.t1